MRLSQWLYRAAFSCAYLFASLGLAACGNTCFAGISSNGTAVIVVKVSDPPPACSLVRAQGMMNVIALKSLPCERCTAAARAEHVFVALRSIQLRLANTGNVGTGDWIELVPHLANHPRQIDLVGTSSPEILAQNVSVPAGQYHQLRLEFSAPSAANAEEFLSSNACGEKRSNCVVLADGRASPLRWPTDAPELVVPLDNELLLVLPDSSTDLKLDLELRQQFYFSPGDGWSSQHTLVAHATAVRLDATDAEAAIPH